VDSLVTALLGILRVPTAINGATLFGPSSLTHGAAEGGLMVEVQKAVVAATAIDRPLRKAGSQLLVETAAALGAAMLAVHAFFPPAVARPGCTTQAGAQPVYGRDGELLEDRLFEAAEAVLRQTVRIVHLRSEAGMTVLRLSTEKPVIHSHTEAGG
jgi:hypothetical protein